MLFCLNNSTARGPIPPAIMQLTPWDAKPGRTPGWCPGLGREVELRSSVANLKPGQDNAQSGLTRCLYRMPRQLSFAYPLLKQVQH